MTFSKLLELFEKIFSNNLVKSVLVVLIAAVIYKAISQLLILRGKRLKSLERKKGETYLRLINSIFKYTVLIFAFFTILSVNNINITSMVAGLGIAGIILGVAVQDALKDIIRGFDIISDNYFKVGDLIEFNGVEGRVLELGIKTTKIKDIKNDNIISIPNRAVEATALVSNVIYIEAPMPYETPLDTAERVVFEMCDIAKANKNIKECTYIGVNKLDDSDIKYMIKAIMRDNAKKLQTTRDMRRIILDTMNKNGITVPYKQIDIHTR